MGQFETVKELILCYGWAVLAIAVIAGVICSGWLDGDVQTYPDWYQQEYAIEEWDYEIYRAELGQDCYLNCRVDTEMDDKDEEYDYCIDMCQIKKVKLYSDSYCNITCDDGSSFMLNITVPDNHAIPAQKIMINNTDSSVSCSAVCYGLFIGFGSR